MAKRLHMSGADYLAIAVSPALVMALVGSLVFFLIEVLYVGDYQARLNYVFALFVFAAVLVARISIEMGSERAAMYSLPLGAAVFVVLLRFVEHPSVFSPVINLALIVVVWWSAHKLTWDCTFIDDNEDSSGEGLMQRVGADESANTTADQPQPRANELAADESEPATWWRRPFTNSGKKHTPGLWVLYFSLAALPLFGVLQRFIPSADEAGRRWAFSMLFVYVAAGLTLLVTTSFLGFRRYLRQRQIEMPAPMAMTWVAMGGAVVAVVMLIATLLPRPAAEYALAQPPWQFGSPEGLTSSRWGRGNDAPEEDPNQQQSPGPAETDHEDAPAGSKVDNQQHEQTAQGDDAKRQGSDKQSGESNQQSGNSDQQPESGESNSAEDAEAEGKPQQQDRQQQDRQPQDPAQDNLQQDNSEARNRQQQPPNEGGEKQGQKSGSQQSSRPPQNSSRPSPTQVLQNVSSALGGLTNLLKWAFYLVLAAVAAYLAWKNRHELLTAARELWRDLRAWLAGLLGKERPPEQEEQAVAATEAATRRRGFREFSNPFDDGRHQKASPEELVRYTFDAFEAWCGDRGHVRRADQTPHELTRIALNAEDEMFRHARELTQLYSQAAYSGGAVSERDAARLAKLWRLMQTAAPLHREALERRELEQASS